MIRLFGSWQAYKSAPNRVVEEQIAVWVAEKEANAERAQVEEDRLRSLQTSGK